MASHCVCFEPRLTAIFRTLSVSSAGCTIWEGCDMKKVDLTTLDICSVIVNRVESMPQSTDYLVFGTSGGRCGGELHRIEIGGRGSNYFRLVIDLYAHAKLWLTF